MIRYEVGQEVYHTRFGRGVVQSITNDDPPIIRVDFSGEPKDLAYGQNLLMRMTVRKKNNTQGSDLDNKTVTNVEASKESFFSSLVLPPEVEIEQFEGMDRFHFKYKGKGFLVIDLKNNSYQIRTREAYLKAIGIEKYKLNNMHPTNPAQIRDISYSDTRILKSLIDYILTENKGVGINQWKAPSRITELDGKVALVCPTCESTFKKAKRCPECGQLIIFDGVPEPKSKRRILENY